METFNSFKTPTVEKAVRILIAVLLIWGGINLWNYVAPTLIKAAENTFWFLLEVGGLALVLGTVAMNRTVLWMWYKGFCKKITRWFVKMDPLTIMDGYLAILRKKYANLESTRIFIEGKKIKLERLLDDKNKLYKDLMGDAEAAKKRNIMNIAVTNATKAKLVQDSINLFTPIYERYQKNTVFLKALSENWGQSIDTLAFTIDSKREEFESMKEMFKGLKSAEDFISSGSEEAQIYGESLKALEDNVSQKIAYINDFEEKAKPLMDNIKVKNQADEDEALKMLSDMMQDQNLKMPNFQTTIITNAKVAEAIPYEQNGKKYGLNQ